ncbi:MAG: hypothetical protein JWO90_364, partial [Solirubrobacterales bacterium]|nr:hypothetical protein [Solirubrobacterales bacterium]
KDLEPALAGGGPNAAAHRGLATLATYHQARRELLFARFVAFWEGLEREGFRARLEYAAAERPSQPVDAGDGPVPLASPPSSP